MTGIIHFDELGRVRPKVSRRSMLAGGAGVALSGLLGTRVTAQAPDATPQASPVMRNGLPMGDARGRLRAMLSRLPSSMIGNHRDALELFSWLDLQTHFSTLGVEPPLGRNDPVAAMMIPMFSTDPLFMYALSSDLGDALGFGLFDVHQVLSAGVTPERVTIYAGGVSFADLTGTWEAAGYEHKTTEWGDYWTIGEQGELDIERGAPLGMGSLNNISLLDDDVVVFAQSLDLLGSVMTLRDVDDATAESDEELSALIDTMPMDAVNAVAFPGEVFRGDAIVPENPGMDSFTTVEELLAGSDAAVGPMPRLELSLCGVTAGIMAPEMPQDGGTPVPQGNPDAIAFMSFLAGSEEEAANAAEVAYWRLENMQSPTTGQVYNERFVPVHPVEDAAEGQVMTITFDSTVAGTANWASMVLSRDVWPFVWLEE